MTTRREDTVGSVEEVLRALRAVLCRYDYAGFVNCFSPLQPRHDTWEKHRAEIQGALGPILDLFLLGRHTRTQDLPRELQDILGSLEEIGVVRIHKELVDSRGIVLQPLLGLWLFYQKPSVQSNLYFGDDSMGLLTRIVPPKPRCDILDLCSGPGIQALWCGSRGHSAMGVEVNPVAVAVAQLNIMMNELAETVAVVQGDLYSGVEGQTFDYIVANPPLLPIPERVNYPFVGDGGSDGFGVTRKIIEGLPDALRPEGQALIIGTCLSDGIVLSILGELLSASERLNLQLNLNVVRHIPAGNGSPFIESLAATAFGAATPEGCTALDQLVDLYESQGGYLATFSLRASHGSGVVVEDRNSVSGSTLWYV